MSQVSKTSFFAYFNYNKRIAQMSQASKTQFLAYLLALLAGQPRFCLVISLVGLIVGLAISKAELIGGEVAVGFSGYSL